MNNWLSEIENVDKEGRDEFALKYGYEPPENATERMARVIGELAGALWKLQIDRNANVFDDLSEDADEIIPRRANNDD